MDLDAANGFTQGFLNTLSTMKLYQQQRLN